MNIRVDKIVYDTFDISINELIRNIDKNKGNVSPEEYWEKHWKQILDDVTMLDQTMFDETIYNQADIRLLNATVRARLHDLSSK